jgi:hypothetical protein
MTDVSEARAADPQISLCSLGLPYTRGSLQPTTVGLLERCLVDGPRQGGRGAPSSSLRDEPSGGVENLFIMLRTDKRGIDCLESMQSCGVHYAASATASSSFAGRKPR